MTDNPVHLENLVLPPRTTSLQIVYTALSLSVPEQSFQGLLMRLQAVSNELVEGEPKRELDETIDWAAQAITGARDAVQGLRSLVVESNDLAAAIGNLGKELAAADSHPPEFTMQIEGALRGLYPILRDEVYRVSGEHYATHSGTRVRSESR